MKKIVNFFRDMSPMQNLVFSLTVIIGYILIGWACGLPEPTCLVKNDVGTIFVSLGILLFASNIVRIFLDLKTTILLFAVSFLLYGIGTGLAIVGLFATICGLGVLIVILSGSFDFPRWMVWMAVLMIIAGYTFRHDSKPTIKEATNYDVVLANCPDVTWKIVVHVKGEKYGNYPYTFYYTGTKDNAIAFANQQKIELKKQGKVASHEYCSFDSTYWPDFSLYHIPSELLLKYGDLDRYRDSKQYEDDCEADSEESN